MEISKFLQRGTFKQPFDSTEQSSAETVNHNVSQSASQVLKALANQENTKPLNADLKIATDMISKIVSEKGDRIEEQLGKKPESIQLAHSDHYSCCGNLMGQMHHNYKT